MTKQQVAFQEFMPFEDSTALRYFQNAHDRSDLENVNVHKAIEKFLDRWIE